MVDLAAPLFVAGHRGLVGSALCRKLETFWEGPILKRSRNELDLREQSDVRAFFAKEKPKYVILAAAKVGGIVANNTYPADFIRDNLQIQTNVIDAAFHSGVKTFLFLGSSCIYPKFAPQPMPESCLMTGALEPTNEAYAIAKIAGLKMCHYYRKQFGWDAISLMPTNLYGPGDNFDLHTSHVLPALLRKCHEAKLAGDSSIVLWGTGTPRREFLHVDDLADAACFLLQQERDLSDSPDLLNVGTGEDIAIVALAHLIKDVVGFEGAIEHDLSKPDGTPRKLMDVSLLSQLGWKATIPLREGIEQTYEWYLSNVA